MAVDAASLKTVAVQLRSLSADPDNQPIIAREEGCLSALVSFVDAQDPDICPIALAALRYLSAHPDNTTLLRAEAPLLRALKDAAVAPHLDDSTTEDAVRVLRALVPDTEAEATMEIDLLDRRRRKRHELLPPTDPAPEPDSPELPLVDPEVHLLPQPQLARVHVPGLSDEDLREYLEDALVVQAGLVSVAFEIGPEVAVIYSRIPDAALIDVIARIANLPAELLPPDEDPATEEKHPAEQEQEAEEEQPPSQDHPDAGYVDYEAKLRYQKYVEEQQHRSTLVHGGGTSLAARLEEQRRAEQRQQARTGRLLNRIGKGFSSGWGFW